VKTIVAGCLSGPENCGSVVGDNGMAITNYIREIGRGKDGARSLTREQAYDLFCQVLDRRVTDLEIGGFALAMRIKGESLNELSGFLDATHERCLRIESTRPTVVLPSYNGARKLPNLTQGLFDRGYSESDVKALLGGSWLRAMRKFCG